MAGTFGSGSRSSFGSGSSWARPTHQLTQTQLLGLMMAQKQHHRSLLGSILHKGGHGLGFALRQILRPAYGMAEGTRRGLQGEGFDAEDYLKGFSRCFQLKHKTTFSDVIRQEFPKFGREHKTLTGVGGFGLDVITDPTLPLQILAVAASGGTLAPELIAGRIALARAAETTLTASERLAQGRKAVAIFREAGPEYKSAKAAAHYENILTRNEMRRAAGLQPYELDRADAMGLEMSRTHAKLALEGDKVIQATYKVPFGPRVPLTPTAIGGKRVAPLSPKLLRTAKGEGILGKVPTFPTIARHTGKIFRHGFGLEEYMQPALIANHAAQTLTEEYLKYGTELFSKHPMFKNEDKIYDAWSWAEKQSELIGPGRVFNEQHAADAVARGAITKEQADFLKDYHQYTEFLRARDTEFGIPYAKDLPENKLYVPHIYTAEGMPITLSKTALPNFTKERVGNMTAEEMHRIHLAKKAGTATAEEKSLMTHPVKLLMTRTRRGAAAHANEALLKVMTTSAGVPTKVMDLKAMDGLQHQLERSLLMYDKYAWVYDANKRKTWVANRTRAIRKELEVAANKADKRLKKQHAAATHQDEWRKIMDKRLRVLEQLDKKKAEAVEKARKEFQEHVVTAEKMGKLYGSKANKLEKRIARGVWKKNENIPENFVKLGTRKINGHEYAFTPEVHAGLKRIEVAVRNEEELQQLSGMAHKWMAEWKVLVTSVNPGYRIRNTLSDMWNMYISGVPMWAIAKYGVRASKMYKTANNVRNKMIAAHAAGENLKLTKKEVYALRRWEEAANQGVMSGLFQGDVNVVAHLVQHGGASKAYLARGNPFRAYERAMGTMNRHVENVGRFTHFLYRRESEKLGVQAAADWTKKAHFDYSELSAVEREKFRKVIPFYTWTRKNIPYQLLQLVSAPGRYATFPKMVRSSAEIATGGTDVDNEGLLPSYLADKMAFQVPWPGSNNWMLPMVGVGDLAKISGGPKQFAEELLNMSGPWIKMPYELATGRSIFTGEKIADRERTPIGGIAASVLPFVPGSNVGPTSRGGVRSQGTNPWLAYALGQVPLGQVFLNAGSPVARDKRGGVGPFSFKDIAYGTGVPIYTRNTEQEMVIAQLNYAEELKRFIRKLRDRGVLPEAEQPKQSHFQKQLMEVMARGQ